MSDHDVNRVVLTGRVDSEPEMRYTPSGEPYTTFFITNVGTSITGTQRTEQFRLLARGDPLAERCGELAPKTRLLVVGYLHYCSSDNEADCIRFPLEVCVDRYVVLSNWHVVSGDDSLSEGLLLRQTLRYRQRSTKSFKIQTVDRRKHLVTAARLSELVS